MNIVVLVKQVPDTDGRRPGRALSGPIYEEIADG